MDQEKEKQVYQFIVDYIIEHMYAPTIREIGKSVGLRSTSSVATYMMRLEAKGLIMVEPDSMIEELKQLRAEKSGIR